MPKYSSILTGIHPLSESLIRRIHDFKYGRTSSSDHIIDSFQKDIDNLISLLLKTFPIAVSTGNLGWFDLFRPFSEGLQGITHKDDITDFPVARNPLTNTFYRQPIIEGEISHAGSVLEVSRHPYLSGNILQTDFLPDTLKNTGWSLCLPGPFSFSRAVTINSEGLKVYGSIDDLMIDFTTILVNELQYLFSEGFSHIVIDESSIAWEPFNSDSASLIKDLWNQIATGSSLKIVIHTYRRLTNEKLQLLFDSKAWGVGVDCIQNDPHQLVDHDFNGKTFLAGVVDAQSYFRDADGELVVEEIDELVKTADVLADSQSKEIILAPTSRLEFVPRSVADLKLQTLGKTLEKLQEA